MNLLDRLLPLVAAYPIAEARHRRWRAQAARWARRQWLSPAQHTALDAAYPTPSYRPAWPVRVGLFVFGWIGLVIGGGTWLLLAQPGVTFGAVLALGGAGFALEASIREKRCYYAGLDQAFLYAALLAAGVLVSRVFHFETGGVDADLGSLRLLPLLVLWFGLATAAVLRYAEPGVTVAAFVLYLLIIANVLLPFAAGRVALPLALLAAAGGAVWLARAPTRATPAAYYYETARQTLRGGALVIVYLSVNYLVVREGNAGLRGQYPSEHPPLGLLFGLLTGALPFVYIGLGLRRADRLLLTLGFATLLFSLYTLRTYRAVLPLSVATTLAGVLLLTLALFGLRYLRPARHGLTSLTDAADAAPEDGNPFSLGNLEALAAAQLAGGPTAVEAGPTTEFGGGEFGGGGASSTY